jgi:hypothetical protein
MHIMSNFNLWEMCHVETYRIMIPFCLCHDLDAGTRNNCAVLRLVLGLTLIQYIFIWRDIIKIHQEKTIVIVLYLNRRGNKDISKYIR